MSSTTMIVVTSTGFFVATDLWNMETKVYRSDEMTYSFNGCYPTTKNWNQKKISLPASGAYILSILVELTATASRLENGTTELLIRSQL